MIPDKKKSLPRVGGQLKEVISISDDFDEPLPCELLELFYHDKSEYLTTPIVSDYYLATFF